MRLSDLPKVSHLVTVLSISDEDLTPMLVLLELEERAITGRKGKKQARALVHPRGVEDLNPRAKKAGLVPLAHWYSQQLLF